MRGARNFSPVADFSAALSSSVANIVGSGRVCITLGGDHSVAIGDVGDLVPYISSWNFGIKYNAAKACLGTLHTERLICLCTWVR